MVRLVPEDSEIYLEQARNEIGGKNRLAHYGLYALAGKRFVKLENVSISRGNKLYGYIPARNECGVESSLNHHFDGRQRQELDSLKAKVKVLDKESLFQTKLCPHHIISVNNV